MPAQNIFFFAKLQFFYITLSCLCVSVLDVSMS